MSAQAVKANCGHWTTWYPPPGLKGLSDTRFRGVDPPKLCAKCAEKAAS